MIKNKVRVDLVVHEKELKRTTNTGRLIKEVLINSNIWVRGKKDSPLDHSKILDLGLHPLLLYPSEDAVVLDEDFISDRGFQKPIQLIVPDGNWRQASKVHYRVSEFNALMRVTLPKGIADRSSLLRQESKDEGMSTLESIAHALHFLEGPDVGQHVLEAYHLKKKATLKARLGK